MLSVPDGIYGWSNDKRPPLIQPVLSLDGRSQQSQRIDKRAMLLWAVDDILVEDGEQILLKPLCIMLLYLLMRLEELLNGLLQTFGQRMWYCLCRERRVEQPNGVSERAEIRLSALLNLKPHAAMENPKAGVQVTYPDMFPQLSPKEARAIGSRSSDCRKQNVPMFKAGW
jgi:hypothetical protein